MSIPTIILSQNRILNNFINFTKLVLYKIIFVWYPDDNMTL